MELEPVLTMFLLFMGGIGHRAEPIPVLGWFERFAERVSGQPAWASLPCGLAINWPVARS